MSATSQLDVEIAGMSCDHCVRAVREALAEVPGVEVEEVRIGRASLRYDPARADLAQITDAIDDAGYPARPA